MKRMEPLTILDQDLLSLWIRVSLKALGQKLNGIGEVGLVIALGLEDEAQVLGRIAVELVLLKDLFKHLFSSCILALQGRNLILCASSKFQCKPESGRECRVHS